MYKRKNWKSTSNKAPDHGTYDWTKEDRFALYWCVDNNIVIYADNEPFEGPWKINIKIKDKINKSPKAYDKNEVLKKIFEFYRYYADKYRPKDEF